MIQDKKTLFSGMQATGTLTLGNFAGALKNWVTLSDQYECFYCVVDLHSITRAAGSVDAAQTRARSVDALYCSRTGSGKKLYLLPVTCLCACGIGMDFKLFYLYGRIKPHDAV